MEKVIFENKCKEKLVGVIHRSPSEFSKFVILVHGFTGDKDEKGLFLSASDYFLQHGYSVFRFDMRGSGESEGNFEQTGIKEECEDLLSAVSFLKDKESLSDEGIYIVAFSLGATVLLMNYRRLSKVKAMAFWSPAFFPNRDMFPRYQTDEILKELKTGGYFIKSGLKVGKKIISDLKRCNLVPVLGSVKIPTIVIHGERDDKISIDSSRIGCSLLNGYGKFVELPNACHSYRFPEKARELAFSETVSFFNSFAMQ